MYGGVVRIEVKEVEFLPSAALYGNRSLAEPTNVKVPSDRLIGDPL